MSRKQTPLCLLCTIVERGGGQRAFRTYEKHGIALHYRISGEGTASSDLLDLLGFGTSERDILISPARRSAVDALVEEIHRDGSHMRAKGILFVLPLTAASAKIAGALLGAHISHAEEGTAKAAGARGGTVIRSHILRSEEHDSFGGPTFAGERELLVIVASSQGERNAIMESIDKAHGGESAAHAILYSMPIEQMVHIS